MAKSTLAHPASTERLLEVLGEVRRGPPSGSEDVSENGDGEERDEDNVRGAGGLEGFSGTISKGRDRMRNQFKAVVKQIFDEQWGVPGTAKDFMQRECPEGRLCSKDQGDRLAAAVRKRWQQIWRSKERRYGPFSRALKYSFQHFESYLDDLDLPPQEEIVQVGSAVRQVTQSVLAAVDSRDNGSAHRGQNSERTEVERGEEPGEVTLWKDPIMRELLVEESFTRVLSPALHELRSALRAAPSPVIGEGEEMNQVNFAMCDQFMSLLLDSLKAAVFESKAKESVEVIKSKFVKKIGKGLSNLEGQAARGHPHAGLISILKSCAEKIKSAIASLTQDIVEKQGGDAVVESVSLDARSRLLPQTSTFLKRREETEIAWQWSERDSSVFQKHIRFSGGGTEEQFTGPTHSKLTSVIQIMNDTLHAGLTDKNGKQVILLSDARSHIDYLKAQHAGRQGEEPLQGVVSHEKVLALEAHGEGPHSSRTKPDPTPVNEVVPPLREAPRKISDLVKLKQPKEQAVIEKSLDPDQLNAIVKWQTLTREKIERMQGLLPENSILDEFERELRSLEETVRRANDRVVKTHEALQQHAATIVRMARMRKRTKTIEDFGSFRDDYILLSQFLNSLAVHEKGNKSLFAASGACKNLLAKVDEARERSRKAEEYFRVILPETTGGISPVTLGLLEGGEYNGNGGEGILRRLETIKRDIPPLYELCDTEYEFEDDDKRAQYTEEVNAAMKAMQGLFKKLTFSDYLPPEESSALLIAIDLEGENEEEVPISHDEEEAPEEETPRLRESKVELAETVAGKLENLLNEERKLAIHCLAVLCVPESAGNTGTGLKVGRLRFYLQKLFPGLKLPDTKLSGQKDLLFKLLRSVAFVHTSAERAWKESAEGKRHDEWTNGNLRVDQASLGHPFPFVVSLNNYRNFVFTGTDKGLEYLIESGAELTQEQVETYRNVRDEEKRRYANIKGSSRTRVGKLRTSSDR